jgi:general secretion pathway protein I
MRQNGFSLIEILVAFSIMALSLTMISKTLASNTRSISNLEHRQTANLIAEGLVNSKSSLPPEGWNDEGVNGVYRWRVTSSPATAKQIQVVRPQNIVMPTGEKTKETSFYQVDIRVFWKDGAKERVVSHSVLLPVAKYA